MALNNGIRYAIDRKAFGQIISEFGLIQEMIANCATGIFVVNRFATATGGLIDKALAGVDKNDTKEIQEDASRTTQSSAASYEGVGQRDARHGGR